MSACLYVYAHVRLGVHKDRWYVPFLAALHVIVSCRAVQLRMTAARVTSPVLAMLLFTDSTASFEDTSIHLGMIDGTGSSIAYKNCTFVSDVSPFARVPLFVMLISWCVLFFFLSYHFAL